MSVTVWKQETQRDSFWKNVGRINFNKPGTTWFHWKFDPIDNPIDPIESLYIKHLVIVTIKALKKQSLKQYFNDLFYSTHDASHTVFFDYF